MAPFASIFTNSPEDLMKSFFLILAAISWIPFTYWTILYLRESRNQPSGKAIYRRGVLGFGVPFWLIDVIFSVAVIPEHGILSVIYWSAIFLYILFPVCLWAGYFWGKGMAAILPGDRDR
ncbi:hypothetical protein ACN9MG_31030 [Burkholderia ambifaria]|uniref:hypothetical protein n=1 Tax=Burkholderia TaxID=32008 RepID=UPI00158A3196|nr:hypothetical protein [Burkholderia ambifaria]